MKTKQKKEKSYLLQRRRISIYKSAIEYIEKQARPQNFHFQFSLLGKHLNCSSYISRGFFHLGLLGKFSYEYVIKESSYQFFFLYLNIEGAKVIRYLRSKEKKLFFGLFSFYFLPWLSMGQTHW